MIPQENFVTGEELLEHTYNWLSRRHPDGPEWNRPDFHCFRDCDPIVRSIVAMDAVESEIANGAWGQLLWNTFPNWREVLTLAKSGYNSMGSVEQAQAIDQLAAKLVEYEVQCATAMARVEGGSFGEQFGNFTSIGYSDVEFKSQLAFMDESLHFRRCNWLHEQSVAIQRATAA